jgi:glycosyltransferase involved in cell wall biosynthesis
MNDPADSSDLSASAGSRASSIVVHRADREVGPPSPPSPRSVTGQWRALDATFDRLKSDLAEALGHNEQAASVARYPQGFLLSVLIPVYNEERSLPTLLSKLLAVPVPMEIVLVDDGSTDRSRQILSRLIGVSPFKVVLKEANAGKGAALRTALEQATGSVVMIQDADLEYDPSDIPGLLGPILEGWADVVYGSRFLETKRPQTSLIHRLGNGALTHLSNVFTGLHLTDMETCYKVFRRETLAGVSWEQDRFGFEPEITARLARKKARFAEAPIRYAPRSYAEGKKIGWRDLLATLGCIMKYRYFAE